MKILLVDDDNGDRATLKRAIGKSSIDATFTEAASLDEALNTLRREVPDLVLLDYQMPGTEALEGLDQIRQLEPFVPIILTTGYGDELLAARAIHAGADDYLPKDHLNSPVLANAVQNAIDKARYRQALEESRRELEQFAYVLSHDLRAPLNQINSFSELLKDDLQEGRQEDVATYLDFIRRAASDASSLIRMLTDFLRVDKVELTSEPVDLQALLDELCRMLSEQNSKAVNAFHIDVQELPVIDSQPVLLRQILQNLLSNAIKYNDNERPHIDVTSRNGEGRVVIIVADDGIGIEEKYREQIFQPFTRLHGKDEYRGSGLGLAICAKNAARLGGSLSCEANTNGGSRFILTLPVKSP